MIKTQHPNDIEDQIEKRRMIRSYKRLEIPIVVKKKFDFYRDSKLMYLGTIKPYDIDPDNWYGIKMPNEFTWLIDSLQGSMKSKLIQTMLPYFYKKGYYICIFESKGYDLTIGLKKHQEMERIHPEAYNVTLPVHSMLPSYLVAKNLSLMQRLDTKILKQVSEVVTIPASALRSMRDWEKLFRSSEAGSEHLHYINKMHDGNINKMIKQIDKRYYMSEGSKVDINYHTKHQLLRKLLLFHKNDEFLNARKANEIDFVKVWDQDNPPIVTFPMCQRNSDYMSIYAKVIIEQQMRFSIYMRSKGKRVKIVNIWDDCQLFLDKRSDSNNPGKESIKESIRAGRDKGFNNIFVIQDDSDFTTEIMNGCTEYFIGNVNSTRALPIHEDQKWMVEDNRIKLREVPLPNGYSVKYIPYLHIPRNSLDSTTFYPADPNCGGY